MKFRFFGRRFLKVFVLLFLLFGCSRYHPEEFRAASPKVMSPPGSHWKSAQIFVGYHPGRFTYTSHISSEVFYVLRMDDGHKQDFTLDLFSSRELADEKDSDFTAKRKANFTLRFAPDGHALALSSDGGLRWNYVALDAGSAPLFCRHIFFSASIQKDLWSAAPTTRDLALEILHTQVNFDQPHGKISGHATSDPLASDEMGSFARELTGAARFVCEHPEDKTLGKELAKALILPGDQIDFGGSNRDEAAQEMALCMARFVRGDRGIRELLLNRLKQPELPSHHQRGRAAVALSNVPTQEIQEALARTVFEETCPDNQVIWSLARATSLLHAATPNTLQTLIKTSELPSCLSAISALRGLASTKIPEAKETVRRISSQPCSEEFPKGDQIFIFKIWNEVESANPRVTLNPACWAKAAISSGF